MGELILLDPRLPYTAGFVVIPQLEPVYAPALPAAEAGALSPGRPRGARR